MVKYGTYLYHSNSSTRNRYRQSPDPSHALPTRVRLPPLMSIWRYTGYLRVGSG